MNKETSATMYVPHVDIDNSYSADGIIGLLEESGVKANIDCINWPEFPYKPLTILSMGHTDDCLYIDFFVRCNYLRAMNYETNSPVHEDSSVAMAFMPCEDSDNFIYLEFNCIGTKAGYIITPEKEEFIDPSVLDQIKVSPSCGFKPFRELEGLFSWNILVEIPFSILGMEHISFPADKIKCNFFKCASGTQQPHFLSWQPVDSCKPNFKDAKSLGNIVLE